MRTIALVVHAALAAVVVSAVPSRAQDPPPSPPPASAPAPAVVLTHARTLRFDGDGRRTMTVEADVQINTAAGLESFSSLDLWYSSDRESASLDWLEILKASGERVRPSNLAMDDRRASGVFESDTFHDMATRHVTVPSLAVGDRLRYRYTITGRAPEVPGQFAASLQFPRDMTTRDATLEVEFPAGTPVKIWSREGTPQQDVVEGTRRRIRWRRTDLTPEPEAALTIEALVSEGEPEPASDVIVSSFPSWEAVGSWYRGVLADVAVDRAPVAAKARALTESATTEQAKVEALYRFVATEIRYVSLAFGLGRVQPRAPALVLETGYGDCKDKHFLLAALAREVGVVLDPVLISATDVLVPEAPSFTQFDHLISVWRRAPSPTDWVWLDSTSGFTGPGVLLAHLRGKQALLVHEAPALVTAGDRVPPDRLDMNATGSLAADGTQTITLDRVLGGDRAILYRLLGGDRWDAEQTKAHATELLEADGLTRHTVTRAALTWGDDPWGEVTLSYTATVKYGLASTVEKKTLWVWTPPSLLLDPEKMPSPWRMPLGPAGRSTFSLTYTLPDGWQAEPPVDLTLSPPFARYQSRHTADGRVLKVERVLEWGDVTLEASDRAAYTNFRKAIGDDRAQQIGLRITPAAASTDLAGDVLAQARAAAQAGHRAKAVELFEQVTAQQPDHPYAWLELGRTYSWLGRHKLAQKAYERQITIDPQSQYAYTHLALALRELGHTSEAEAAYRKQLEIVPLDKMTNRNLGVLLLELNRPQDAVPVLETAVSVDRQDAFSRVVLGRAYLQAGASAKALEALEAAAASSPPSPLVLNEAAWWLVEHDTELPRAREYASRGLAAATGMVGAATLVQMRDFRLGAMGFLVSLWDTLGWIAFKSGDLETARPLLEAAHEFSDSSEVSWHLGQLHEREGRGVAALLAYGRAATAVRAPRPFGRVRADEAAAAVRRLEAAGVSVPGGVAAADLASRSSSLRIGRLPAVQRGEVVVRLDPTGPVGDAMVLSGEVPPELVPALKGTSAPGSAVARARQATLYRIASVECATTGACSLVWQRQP